MSEQKLLPCPFCGETEHLYPAYLLDKDGKLIEPPYAIDCIGCGVDLIPREGMSGIDAWNKRAPSHQALVDALETLVSAKAIAGVRKLVAGWNGEDRPGPYNERHPARLGASLPTNCGDVYALDEAMQSARAVLNAARGERQ